MESMFQEMAELWLGNIRCRDEETYHPLHRERCGHQSIE